MESRESYLRLGSKGSWYLITISSALCLLFGISSISLFTYNPVGISFSTSIGAFGVTIGICLYSRIFQKKYLARQSNPWISGFLLTGFQLSTLIAYYYDPTNHGSITTSLGLSMVLPILLLEKFSFLHYIGAGISLAAFGILIYFSIEAWTTYSIYFTVNAIMLLSIWWILPRSHRSLESLIVPTGINFSLNLLFVLLLMVLEVFPFGNEIGLIYLGVIGGAAILTGAIFMMFEDAKDFGPMSCVVIGIIQAISEWLIMGNQGNNFKFYTTIGIAVGLEIMIFPQIWKQKTTKKS